MMGTARCPNCSGLNVRSTRVVETTHVHPVVGLILGSVAAGFFAINTGEIMPAIVVAVGGFFLPLHMPIQKRDLGIQSQCHQCDWSWTRQAERAKPHVGSRSRPRTMPR